MKIPSLFVDLSKKIIYIYIVQCTNQQKKINKGKCKHLRKLIFFNKIGIYFIENSTFSFCGLKM